MTASHSRAALTPRADARPLLRVSVLALLAAPLLLLPSPASARASLRQAAPRDSAAAAADALSLAKAAQQRFERVRRQWLTVTRTWGSAPCDEIVGRMCHIRDEGDDWWPVAEDGRIAEAREELLAELARAAHQSPKDPWILGQRVTYLAEVGRWQEAEALARACASEDPGGCPSLLGLTLHGQGRFREAEAAFGRALAQMDERARGRWTDPRVLLDGSARAWVDAARERGAPDLEAALELLWRLADPLYLVEGNDRLTEHWARWTAARLRSSSRNPHGLSWGRDLEELLLRYGWEVGWERTAPAPGQAETVVGHQHPETRGYLPPGRVLKDPADFGPEEWRLSDPQARTGYAPPYAPVIIPAQGEIRIFPRGDRAWVLASFALPEDSTQHAAHEHPPFVPPASQAGATLQAGLFLLPLLGGGGGEPLEVRRRGSALGALLLEAPSGDYVASLEVWSPQAGLAGRLRRGLVVPHTPADVPTLSDLVLLERLLPDSATLEDALPHVRLEGAARSGEAIVVGWEMHGLGWRPLETLSYRLSLSRTERGLLEKVGDWLGLADEESLQRLAWSEPAASRPGPRFRSVALELPALEPGVYRLRLELTTVGRGTLLSERSLVVRP